MECVDIAYRKSEKKINSISGRNSAASAVSQNSKGIFKPLKIMNEIKLFSKTQKVEKSRLSAKNAISIISEGTETQKPKTLAEVPVTTPANQCPIKGCGRVFKIGRNTKANIKAHIKTFHGGKTQNSQKS